MNNIQSHLDEDPYVNWKFAETTEKERTLLASIYRDLNIISRKVSGLYLLVDEHELKLEDLNMRRSVLMFVREMADQFGEE